VRDLAAESVAGLLQRPGRSALTMLGAIVGTGGFVAIVGLSQTASGQIGSQFSAAQAAQVTVLDTGASRAGGAAMDFPADAGSRAERIHGVVAAGVWWHVQFGQPPLSDLPGTTRRLALPVIAATPGALAASDARLRTGVLFNQFQQQRAQNVAVIGEFAARQLRISSLRDQPVIFIAGQPFSVVGIVASDQRPQQLSFGVAVPESTALRLWGPPSPGNAAELLIRTRLGAAAVVAGQAAVAERPDNPALLTATASPGAYRFQHALSGCLGALFLAVAAVALVVGAGSIASATSAAVLERASEIRLRRALGARPRHIGLQFLTESGALGLLGGLLGAGPGVLTIVLVAICHDWTPLLDPRIVLAAPLAGGLTGLLAGACPALRAAALGPMAAPG
jgi:putative ABC transport system permease protein